MAHSKIIQQSLAADGFHAAPIRPPHLIDDGLTAVGDDLNITGKQQLSSLTVEVEGERSVVIYNSCRILFERRPDACLTLVRV
ncbi:MULTISPECIES: hypothetical protein [unclassified Synechococcus]|uniref:hypothetical protein n=1 Tax=unclassified Synechococcus TaxID=2626047 RepID=UPI0039AF4B1B